MKMTNTTDEAVKILLNGGVGVLPTDTVYGLVARAADEKAVARFYALKHREHKPGTVIAASVEQLVTLGVKRRYLTAVAHLWPNPLSIIIPASDGLMFLHQGLDSLAIRIPRDLALHNILKLTGPLVTSSANQPGRPASTNIAQAQGYFGSAVDFYTDGGDLTNREPSTIIRVMDDAIEVIRPGALQITETGRISE